jgi:hypothetical protein
MVATVKKKARAATVKVSIVQPKVKKENRAASVIAKSRVRTKTSVDFVKAVRGR